MQDSESANHDGITSPDEIEQQLRMLQFILSLLYKVFPGLQPIVEDIAKVIAKAYRAYLILMLPFMVLIEFVIVYDLIQELGTVPMDNTQVILDIIVLFVLGIVIAIVSRDAFRVALAIKYSLKR